MRRLPWLGLLLIYALSSLTVDHAGRSPGGPAVPLGRLSREHTFGQTFVVERDGLVAVRVRFRSDLRAGEDPIIFRLHSVEDGLPDLATTVLPVRSLTLSDTTTFEFPAVSPIFSPARLTTTLRFDLEAPTLAPGAGITLLGMRDSYAGGELFRSGVALPAIDMAFEPIYRQRRLDALLPISRMAQAKPGLLGWPGLYTLLAYSCCLGIARGLRALWRALRRG